MKFLILVCLVAAVSAEISINKYMRPKAQERFYDLFKAIEFAKNERVVGGIEAAPNSRPFQAGLFLTLPGGTAFCGGSLISTGFALTAAHCVWDGTNTVSRWTVVLGAHNIYDENEAGTVRVQSTTAIMHPNWTPSLLQNDIALIKLPTTVTLTPKIQLSTLPPRSAADNNFSGQTSKVSGWGKDSDSATAVSPVLREGTLDVMANSNCNTFYLGVIQATMVCTSGSGGKGSCSGDSGGPLTVQLDGKTTQIGIVSFGLALGCERGWPSVYTRVTNYLDWISSTANIQLP